MKLFEEGKIGSLTVKNRIAMAPMGSRADQGGWFSQRDIDYFTERAKGGVGLIITGAVSCSEEFEPAPCQLLNSMKQNFRLAVIAEQVHMYGAKLCLQLSPGIGRMNWIDPYTPPYSSSPIPSYAYADLICKEIPTDGVKRLIKAMGQSAFLAKEAGVDMVQVHAYGGYLIDQFTSAKWNHRTDEYGGSFENRQRFLFEIIEEIKKRCGADFPISVKLTIESTGDTERPLEEGIAIAKRLAEIPIDLLDIGFGAYTCRWRMIGSVYQTKGFDVEAAGMVKKLITNIPIMIHGKLNHADVAEKALQDKCADFIAIGHGLVADPRWANKVKNNKADEINPCIGCHDCQFYGYKGRPRPCAVNPLSMHENEYKLTKAEEDKKILVIGAGPGGMRAAITAAQRGFEVALWEKNGYLGGTLAAAGAPDFKEDVKDQVNYLTRQVYKHNIDLKLHKTATIEDVKAYNPDYVVVATGADPIIIRVPGYDKPNVSTAVPVLLKQVEVGQKVAVIGGGDVGCELGVALSMDGKDVTIVEMLDDILKLAKSFVSVHQHLKYLVKNSTAKVLTKAKLVEILEDGIIVEMDGEQKKIECDSIVFATGFKSNHDLYEQIKAAGYEVVNIGDNVQPGKVIHATHAGYHSIRIL